MVATYSVLVSSRDLTVVQLAAAARQLTNATQVIEDGHQVRVTFRTDGPLSAAVAAALGLRAKLRHMDVQPALNILDGGRVY